MKTCYVNADTRAIADLVAPGELTRWWTITRINVPSAQRGRGHGSALLKRIIAEADEEGKTLALEPVPTGGLEYEDLVAWYKRHGFTESYQGYMVRRPRKEQQW